jgi:hypothetical protein
MLKIGTHDDTFASHYVLVDPTPPGGPDEDDVALLDPAQPLNSSEFSWSLSDSYKHLKSDRTIAREWRRAKISPRQLSGVWVFGRWRSADQRSLAAALLQLIAAQAATPAGTVPIDWNRATVVRGRWMRGHGVEFRHNAYPGEVIAFLVGYEWRHRSDGAVRVEILDHRPGLHRPPGGATS